MTTLMGGNCSSDSISLPDGSSYFARDVGPVATAALEEFEARTLTWLDLVEIAQDAGQRDALEIFERRAREWHAALPPHREPEAPQPQKRRRAKA
jgi:hypothetical protein